MSAAPVHTPVLHVARDLAARPPVTVRAWQRADGMVIIESNMLTAAPLGLLPGQWVTIQIGAKEDGYQVQISTLDTTTQD